MVIVSHNHLEVEREAPLLRTTSYSNVSVSQSVSLFLQPHLHVLKASDGMDGEASLLFSSSSSSSLAFTANKKTVKVNTKRT